MCFMATFWLKVNFFIKETLLTANYHYVLSKWWEYFVNKLQVSAVGRTWLTVLQTIIKRLIHWTAWLAHAAQNKGSITSRVVSILFESTGQQSTIAVDSGEQLWRCQLGLLEALKLATLTLVLQFLLKQLLL